MTDKEVMQMALDALEAPYPGIRTDFCDAMTYREKVKTAIEALRTALAQPEKEWVGLTDDEIAKLRINNSDGNFSLPFSFARAMEALLKEKNQ